MILTACDSVCARTCTCGVRVCAHADDFADLVCGCWMKGGPLTGQLLLFPHATKVHAFVFKGDGSTLFAVFLASAATQPRIYVDVENAVVAAGLGAGTS